MDILEFASEYSIPVTPVQRVVLKLLYGIPLDRAFNFPVRTILDTERRVTQEESFTEHSYAEKLKLSDALRLPLAPTRDAALILGRRSGKDHLLALISTYEAATSVPVTWGDTPPQPTVFHHCATKEKAELAADKLNKLNKLNKLHVPPGQIRFVSLARQGAGSSCRLLILNELDFQQEPEAVWDETRLIIGDSGRSLLVTTPNYKSKFIDRTYSDRDALFINIPTWEMVGEEVVPSKALLDQAQSDRRTFEFEYGARYRKVGKCERCGREAQFAIVSQEDQERIKQSPPPPYADPKGRFACRDDAGHYLSDGCHAVEL